MKNLAIFTFSFFMAIMVNAQNQKTEIWPGQVPGEEKPKTEAITNDKAEKGTLYVTEVTNPVLEHFETYNPVGKKAFIVCPGGGYNILAYDKEGTEVAQWLAQIGYTAFVLQYRVPKKQESALLDIQRSIRLLRSRGYEKIGIIGFSAGASLCARASTRFNEKLYTPVDALDSLSCRPDLTMLIYPAYMDLGEGRSLTPELSVTEQTPPVFVFQTADDTHGNSALVISQALRDKKVPVELHLLPKGGHGYGLRKGNSAAELWPVLAEKWLESNL